MITRARKYLNYLKDKKENGYIVNAHFGHKLKDCYMNLELEHNLQNNFQSVSHILIPQ